MAKNHENQQYPGGIRNRINRVTFGNGDGAISNNANREGQDSPDFGKLDAGPVERTGATSKQHLYNNQQRMGTRHTVSGIAYADLPDYPSAVLGAALYSWYKGNAMYTDLLEEELVTTSGVGVVTRIRDISGNNRDLKINYGNGTLVNAPSLSQVNGTPAWRNEQALGIGDMADSAYGDAFRGPLDIEASGYTAITMFMVYQTADTSAYNVTGPGISTSGDVFSGQLWNTTGDMIAYGSNIAANQHRFETPGNFTGDLFVGRFNVVAITYSNTKNNIQFWMNGQKFAAADGTLPVNSSEDDDYEVIGIGNQFFAVKVFDGQHTMPELVVASGILSDHQVYEMSKWLGARYNIEILPSGG